MIYGETEEGQGEYMEVSEICLLPFRFPQGGYTYKEAIVNTIIAVIEANPGSQVMKILDTF